MWENIVAGLVTSGLIFALTLGLRSGIAGIRSRQYSSALSRRLKIGSPAYTAEWIRGYYQRNGRLGELFTSEVIPGHALQFLTTTEWIFDRPDDGTLLKQSIPLRVVSHRGKSGALKRRSYALRSPDGDEWNDLHAASLGVIADEAGPRIVVGLCRYLDYLAVSGALEDETFEAVRRPSTGTPLRDAGFASVADASSSGLGIHSVGMVSALIYWKEGVPTVLIHRRSNAVSTYSGAMGVVPMFGLQTRDLSAQAEISLTNNFYRELFEELYGGKEAQRLQRNRVEKDWYSKMPELARYCSGDSERGLRVLGFGFDARNGQLIVGSMYEVHDPSFAEEEVGRMQGNWEMSDIEAVPLNGQRLRRMLLDDSFTPACAFTLVRCIEVLGDG